MRAVIDTNILIDYLNGVPDAAVELRRYRDPIVSRISWMEVLVGAAGRDSEPAVRAFLRRFRIQELNEGVAEEALKIRIERRLRLPDAIILACARENGCGLVTRNTRDFNAGEAEIRVPYTLP